MASSPKRSAIEFVKFLRLGFQHYERMELIWRPFVLRHNDVALNYIEEGFIRVQWAAGEI